MNFLHIIIILSLVPALLTNPIDNQDEEDQKSKENGASAELNDFEISTSDFRYSAELNSESQSSEHKQTDQLENLDETTNSSSQGDIKSEEIESKSEEIEHSGDNAITSKVEVTKAQSFENESTTENDSSTAVNAHASESSEELSKNEENSDTKSTNHWSVLGYTVVASVIFGAILSAAIVYVKKHN